MLVLQGDGMDNLLVSGADSAPLRVLLGHGAGAGMDSPFMAAMADGLADQGWQVLRFEFPYMQRQRNSGKKRPPDKAELLLNSFREQVKALAHDKPLVIGGKSMGGRIASLLADALFDEQRIQACICLGYPFHPLGKPDQLRTDHLADLRTPTLVVQGERDAMGRQEEVSTYKLSKQLQLAWLPDGDHSFKPRKSSGHSEASNWALAIEAMDRFLSQQHTGA
ncbi:MULTISPECIES: alpha/beta fold hydrolase [unclassified Synechococcus]|uniref:alpha/beta fold hydrolase n=1 Tax=unclassified Synechococcus TaxID=2626047 RepID=UPI000C5647FD|nr:MULTISPECIES: alpha/beta fold hydrolase [unclassified Synechococcus]MAN18176.1 alpha/beta hydrolase [Synechococcus sp. EAC657]MEC7249278.1 alpha/beta fold hydrolase [Cyanobacteriota bacterium]QNI47570.1 dienelactone hydrolase family protein [Synechococcus sp. A15-60]